MSEFSAYPQEQEVIVLPGTVAMVSNREEPTSGIDDLGVTRTKLSPVTSQSLQFVVGFVFRSSLMSTSSDFGSDSDAVSTCSSSSQSRVVDGLGL